MSYHTIHLILRYDYYRTLFPKVTTNDIDSFRATYQGSEEERQDVFEAYQNADGNMSKVLNEVMLAEDGTCMHISYLIYFVHIMCPYTLRFGISLRCMCPEDLDRFVAMVEKAIDDGEIEMKSQHSKRKRKTAASQRKSKKEAADAEKLASALKAKAQQRDLKNNRENDFNALLSKYSSGKIQNDPPPINDADFEATRSRLESNRCKAKAAQK